MDHVHHNNKVIQIGQNHQKGIRIVVSKLTLRWKATFGFNPCRLPVAFVTNISLYQLVLLDTLQLAAGETGLSSGGGGGDSSCSWVFCSCTELQFG